MSEKYYTVDVDCDYNESRVVLATSKGEAVKKAMKNDYIGVISSTIGGVRYVNGVELTPARDVSEMQYRLKVSQQRRK